MLSIYAFYEDEVLPFRSTAVSVNVENQFLTFLNQF